MARLVLDQAPWGSIPGTGLPHYLYAELLSLSSNEALAFLDFLEQGSVDGVWYWDLENPEVEWMSPGFWALFGYDWKEKQHLASEWQDLIDPDDLQLAVENFRRHCADPGHPYDQVVRYRHKDGSTVWVRCRGVAIRNESGTPVRMLGIHTDVTELQRANEALLQKNVDLEHFAYSVAHDMKAPLRQIGTLAQRIVDKHADSIPEHAQSQLSVLQSRVQRLTRIVDDLMVVARSQGQDSKFEDIEVTDLLEEVLTMIETPSGFVVGIENAPFVFSGARSAVALVLSNLASNAIKHHDRPTGRVDIRASKHGAYVKFTVEDDGPGIAPRDQDRIFDMFQTLGSAANSTGMGLAIVKRLLDIHGAEMSLQSNGRGATFTCIWPPEAAAQP